MFLRPFFVDDGKAGGVWELHITISIIVKGKLPIAINNECGNTPIDGTELYVACIGDSAIVIVDAVTGGTALTANAHL